MSRRFTVALGRHRAPKWVSELVGKVAEAYRDPPADRPRELAHFVRTTHGWGNADRPVRLVSYAPRPTAIVRCPWPVTPLPDLAALARLLDVDQGELAWFADVRGWERTCAPPLRHYTWTTLTKSSGSVRLLAAPKPRLKEIQRRLLRHVLAPIPVHDAAHGGCAGATSAPLSRRTRVPSSCCASICGRSSRRCPPLGCGVCCRWPDCPKPSRTVMTGLLTTVAPRSVWTDPALRTPHLPQGAPSSPQVANLVAFSLDRRLAALAARHRARYTRYVDDLTISGGSSLRAAPFAALVDTIVRDEGFALNVRKSVVLGHAGRQYALGAAVDAHPAVPRPARDALRATLHNCASQARGLSREAFRDHLLGRVAWVGSVPPAHGVRLREIADRIDWG